MVWTDTGASPPIETKPWASSPSMTFRVGRRAITESCDRKIGRAANQFATDSFGLFSSFTSTGGRESMDKKHRAPEPKPPMPNGLQTYLLKT
jgi:hypothetical protein